MKTIPVLTEPVNVVCGKDARRGLYIAIFDPKQENPRVEVGSYWVGKDIRHKRRFLMRVVETGFNEDFDLKQILSAIRETPDQGFSQRDLDYYCSERAWLQLEGEFKEIPSGSRQIRLARVADQPTALQTFLSPTTPEDSILIADADVTYGFAIGHLRSGDKVQPHFVTLEDRFAGYRTAFLGASGFGKSTLVRNVARYWLEHTKYGKILDDLKGEYPFDIKDERGNTVLGLCHHPLASKKLYLLTSRPEDVFEKEQLKVIGGVIPLKFELEDIPPESLKDVATHLSAPQRQFLEMYDSRPDLFRILTKTGDDGEADTSDWHKVFKGWIILKKEAEKVRDEQGDQFQASPADFMPSSYTPIHGVRRQLERLLSRPFMSRDRNVSCLPRIKNLLKQGATIILDKANLSDTDRVLVSTVLAGRLYDHNMQLSSGSREVRSGVIPFVYLVEEAHNLLSNKQAEEGSVFVNFAKTGRSFQIGLVAVTQRPSSIDANIMSQFDNFVTLRLTNEEDVRNLLKAQSMFQGYEGQIREMGRGAAVTAFGEPTRVQPIQVFDWNDNRAKTLLSEEQSALTLRDR